MIKNRNKQKHLMKMIRENQKQKIGGEDNGTIFYKSNKNDSYNNNNNNDNNNNNNNSNNNNRNSIQN